VPSNALVFYGYSGDGLTTSADAQADLSTFKGEDDRNRTFYRAAETLADMIKSSFPALDVKVRPAWTHEALLRQYWQTEGPIEQVHVVCHGGSSGLSLAYGFVKNYERLVVHAAKTIGSCAYLQDQAAAREALAGEDALLAQGLTTYAAVGTQENLFNLVEARRRGAGGYWHVWGCYSGNPFADYHVGAAKAPPIVRDYRNWLAGVMGGDKPGIAAEIAKFFHVPCTAAAGDAGASFFRRAGPGKARPQGKNDPDAAPVWMWPVGNTTWRTYVPSGDTTRVEEKVMMFGKWRSKSDVAAGTPPPWIVDAYTKSTLR
jgi:hypothetical protein